jgi:hypothetical protein
MNSFDNDDGNLGSITTALNNWQIVWIIYTELYQSGPPHRMVDCNSPTLSVEEMWRRVGFMRHAEEFWLLATLITECMARRSAAIDSDCPGDNTDEIANPVLNKFDQNDMRQVNELIVSFENSHIE